MIPRLQSGHRKTAAVVYAAKAGSGGLGLHAATVIAGLETSGPVAALGPGQLEDWSLETPPPADVRWLLPPRPQPSWFAQQVVRRLRPGRFVLGHDRRLARWTKDQLTGVGPGLVYAFTQVGLEPLEWARSRSVPTILDNPTAHIRGFAEVYRTEWARWVGGRYLGHPSEAMVRRVEAEYEMADRIRVSSEWARQSMVARGVPAHKIFVCQLPINRVRFRPPASRRPATGPLRVCYVGSLTVLKGFAYLLRAVRAVGPGRVRVEIVGATGDRGSKELFARETAGLDVTAAPGDPVPAYHRAELFVLPSLMDGFGFVTAEALACGLPAVVTDQCGSAEWVRPGHTGWVIPAADVGALASVIEEALTRRADLPAMGAAARCDIEARNPAAALRQLGDAVGSGVGATA